jgi:hypothetical protein
MRNIGTKRRNCSASQNGIFFELALNLKLKFRLYLPQNLPQQQLTHGKLFVHLVDNNKGVTVSIDVSNV